eukprot:13780213-Ditylum_brightwellii.AAC.1
MTGTNCYEAISALEKVIPNLSKISDQRKKVLELLKMDESKSWGDEIWCGVIQCTSAVKYWLIASKEEEDKCVCAVCKFMAENVTATAFDRKKSVYGAFKNFSNSDSIDVSEYKYMFCKALDTKLMVEEIISNKRKR